MHKRPLSFSVNFFYTVKIYPESLLNLTLLFGQRYHYFYIGVSKKDLQIACPPVYFFGRIPALAHSVSVPALCNAAVCFKWYLGSAWAGGLNCLVTTTFCEIRHLAANFTILENDFQLFADCHLFTGADQFTRWFFLRT